MPNLIKIDELLLSQHRYLSAEDDCYFFMNYYPYYKYGRTPENILIMDFKIDITDINRQAKKLQAINSISQMLEKSLSEISTPQSILVPMPPSKTKNDALHDNRVMTVLKNYCNKQKESDLREIISIKESVPSTHIAGKKTPEEILANLFADIELCHKKKQEIVLVDDVITTGAHFKACKELLRNEFPQANIKGLFIARTPE